jgi:hypothetical protein
MLRLAIALGFVKCSGEVLHDFICDRVNAHIRVISPCDTSQSVMTPELLLLYKFSTIIPYPNALHNPCTGPNVQTCLWGPSFHSQCRVARQ